MSKKRQTTVATRRVSHGEERGVDRSIVALSDQDIEHITRVVATEVPERLSRSHPDIYRDMVAAVTDTITNRLAATRQGTDRYGKTIADVVNQRSAFTKINGPLKQEPYGSVQNTPQASATARQTVYEHLADRNRDVPSLIGGFLDYANPYVSDEYNLQRWINPMIDAGALKIGVGRQVHYHGLAPGKKPAPNHVLRTPKGFMEPVDPDMDHSHAIPLPTSRDGALSRMAGDALLSQGLLDLAGRTSGAPRSPHIDDWPDAGSGVAPRRSTPKGDRLRRLAPMPIEERWSASATPALTEDEQRGVDQYRQKLAHERATAPGSVDTQPVQHAPGGRLPLAPSGYSSRILPSPQDEYGYERYPAMSPATMPGPAPGGLVLSGGLLGSSTAGPGAVMLNDDSTRKAERKPVRKSDKRKLHLTGAGLY